MLKYVLNLFKGLVNFHIKYYRHNCASLKTINKLFLIFENIKHAFRVTSDFSLIFKTIQLKVLTYKIKKNIN